MEQIGPQLRLDEMVDWGLRQNPRQQLTRVNSMGQWVIVRQVAFAKIKVTLNNQPKFSKVRGLSDVQFSNLSIFLNSLLKYRRYSLRSCTWTCEYAK